MSDYDDKVNELRRIANCTPDEVLVDKMLKAYHDHAFADANEAMREAAYARARAQKQMEHAIKRQYPDTRVYYDGDVPHFPRPYIVVYDNCASAHQAHRSLEGQRVCDYAVLFK
ncbi:MAG: hypothetical protein ACPGR8_06260 [Limisphaerales bacterium]